MVSDNLINFKNTERKRIDTKIKVTRLVAENILGSRV